MRAIARACTSTHTHATSLYDTYCPGHQNEENERKIKNIELSS